MGAGEVQGSAGVVQGEGRPQGAPAKPGPAASGRRNRPQDGLPCGRGAPVCAGGGIGDGTVCPAGAEPRFMQRAGWGRGWRPQAARRRRRRANGRSPFRRRSRRACGPPLPPAPAWADAAPHHGGTVQENPVIFAWRRWTRGSSPCGPCAGPASHARLR